MEQYLQRFRIGSQDNELSDTTIESLGRCSDISNGHYNSSKSSVPSLAPFLSCLYVTAC